MNTVTNAPDNCSLISEIRHPLTNISLAIDMLEVTADDKEKELYIAVIKRNTARISEIVAKLIENKPE
jgi:nitrogen-specific signal transduction histidine kinase